MRTEFVLDAQPDQRFARDAFAIVIGQKTKLHTPFGDWPATIADVAVSDDGRQVTFEIEADGIWMAPARISGVNLETATGEVTIIGAADTAREPMAPTSDL